MALIFRGARVPADALVLHSCDNPPCVNPLHLRVGTHLENCADAVNRDRTLFGERNFNAKLTSEIVAAIMSDHRGSSALARIYGVSDATIQAVRTGKTWRRVTNSNKLFQPM